MRFSQKRRLIAGASVLGGLARGDNHNGGEHNLHPISPPEHVIPLERHTIPAKQHRRMTSRGSAGEEISEEGELTEYSGGGRSSKNIGDNQESEDYDPSQPHPSHHDSRREGPISIIELESRRSGFENGFENAESEKSTLSHGVGSRQPVVDEHGRIKLLGHGQWARRPRIKFSAAQVSALKEYHKMHKSQDSHQKKRTIHYRSQSHTNAVTRLDNLYNSQYVGAVGVGTVSHPKGCANSRDDITYIAPILRDQVAKTATTRSRPPSSWFLTPEARICGLRAICAIHHRARTKEGIGFLTPYLKPSPKQQTVRSWTSNSVLASSKGFRARTIFTWVRSQ